MSDSRPPRPKPGSSAVIVLGSFAALSFASGDTSSAVARDCAIVVGLSLLIATLLELRGNLRNLVRADLMALGSLYFLSLAEFLVPQPRFDDLVSVEEIHPALRATLVAFASIALGRHLCPQPGPVLLRLVKFTPKPTVLLGLFWICFFGGFWHMAAAVNFNLEVLVDYFMAPRFSQPWGRGRFGDWRALLFELGMVLYLAPPLAGVILAQRRTYRPFQLALVVAGFLFTLFYGFTSGTRNIIATYLATFLVAFAFTLGRERRKELLVIGAVIAAFMVWATTAMLEFRSVGFQAYLDGYEREVVEADPSFFVDYNLWVIAKLVDLFPRQYDFLGLEIPYLALVRPIPRALWPGKPEGMSTSIEDALGMEGLTLAATFIGEAYMSGGTLGVFLTGLILGGTMGWWNQLGRADNSPFGYLLFASGFFAAVISMRSILMFTTAILPTIAAVAFGLWATNQGLDLRERMRARRHDDH